MGLLDNGKAELFGAIQGGGILNPISEAKGATSERLSRLQDVLGMAGIDAGPLTRAQDALGGMDGLAGSLTGDMGATLGKVNAASDLLNEAAGNLGGCFNVEAALGVLGGAGQQAMAMLGGAVENAYGAVAGLLGGVWESLSDSELAQAIAGVGSSAFGDAVRGAVDSIQQAAEDIEDKVAEWTGQLGAMEKALKDYVAALQLERFTGHPCFQSIVQNCASPETQAALGKLNSFTQN